MEAHSPIAPMPPKATEAEVAEAEATEAEAAEAARLMPARLVRAAESQLSALIRRVEASEQHVQVRCSDGPMVRWDLTHLPV